VEPSGELELSVRFGQIDHAPLGFRVGIKQQMNDYRAAAIDGRGMNIGINADGRLFLGSLEDSAPKADFTSEIHLQVQARPSGDGYTVPLRATSGHDGRTVMITREIPGEWLTGGLALVCSSGPLEPAPAELLPIKNVSLYPPNQQRGGTMRCWFADLTVSAARWRNMTIALTGRFSLRSTR